MNLRITSGTLARRIIRVRREAQDFRPTLERCRQALGETLKTELEGVRVADVCAGSGAVGFELLSRGASHVDFVESNRIRARAISEQAREFGVERHCTVFAEDVRRFLLHGERAYDIIFYDPPYGDPLLDALVDRLCGLLNSGGTLIHERARAAPAACARAAPTRSREYGDSMLDFYTQPPSTP